MSNEQLVISKHPLLLGGFVALSLLSSCSNTEDYNGLDHDNQYSGDDVAYRVNYTVKLDDANVHEVADVKVQYIDADGNIQTANIDGTQWQQPVTYRIAATMNYGLAVRYFSKDNATLTHDTYGFGANLSSPMYKISSEGDSLYYGTLRSNSGEADGVVKYYNGTMDKAEAQTPDGREMIDTTMVYFRLTSVKSDSAVVRKKFEWQ